MNFEPARLAQRSPPPFFCVVKIATQGAKVLTFDVLRGNR
jgi:hypothetical protein